MCRTLATIVKELIEGFSNEQAAKFEMHFIANRPQDDLLSPQQQLEALNNYWRIQLGNLPDNTFEERECLADDIGLSDWIRLFEEWVLPSIINNNLPIGV